jgi:hypothetical protein
MLTPEEMMAKARAEAPTFASFTGPSAHASKRAAALVGSRNSSLLGIAISMYALLCAGLLVRNAYLGMAAAVLPGLAVVLIPTHLTSTAALRHRATVAWLLLVVAACPWQSLAVTAYGEVNAASEADAAKFVITAIACLLAYLARVPSLKYSWPIKALFGYALIAALGGLAATDPSSSMLRTVRFAAVCLAIIWVSSRLTRSRLAVLFMQFAVTISLIALVARAIHLPSSHLFGSRLDGYLLPLQPNALGLVAAGGLICATALLARKELTLRLFASTAPILGVALILTQSRTSVIGFVLSLLVFAGPRLSTRSLLIVGLLALTFLLAVFVQTDTQSHPLTSILTHNESTTTTATLGSRTSEWKAVLRLNDTVLTKAIGQGLAAKSVEVSLSSARYAPVDGSWPAAYLSAGLVGALMLAISVLATARTAIRKRDDLAMMMITYLIISSLVTDVFNDISIGLILFLSFCTSTLMSSPSQNRQLNPSPVGRHLQRDD